MVLIHTLQDLRRQDEARQSQEQAPLLGYSSSTSEPSSFSPISFIELLFPHWKLLSFILGISIAQWAIYIATLCVGSVAPLVPSNGTLTKFGANIPILVAAGQVWRLICPIFLHANFVHIFFNIFFQLRMGFSIEYRYGIWRTMSIYLISGIYGNVFSAACLFCGPLRVGASTSGFGIIGVQIAELALAWHLIHHRHRVLLNMSLFVTFTLLLLLGSNGGNIDHMGHLGGLLAGAALGILMNYDMENKPRWFRFAQFSSIVILVLILLTCLPLIFVLKHACQ